MDHRTFDTLAKGLAQGRNRRSLLKGMLGFGGAVVVGAGVVSETDAARRGYPGPLPKPANPTEPQACTDQNCYGCHECRNGICVDNPQQNCYDHTAECLASSCEPDGGCRYGFDCRVRSGCCNADAQCNQSTGVCECVPGTCCGVECPGCQVCEKGSCVRSGANCYDHTAQCLASVCNEDGSCSYPFDCRVRSGCCTGGSTCDANTGQCVS